MGIKYACDHQCQLLSGVLKPIHSIQIKRQETKEKTKKKLTKILWKDRQSVSQLEVETKTQQEIKLCHFIVEFCDSFLTCFCCNQAKQQSSPVSPFTN